MITHFHNNLWSEGYGMRRSLRVWLLLCAAAGCGGAAESDEAIVDQRLICLCEGSGRNCDR